VGNRLTTQVAEEGIGAIMRRIQKKLVFGQRLLLAGARWFVVVGTLVVGISRAPSMQAQSPQVKSGTAARAQFEVASVRPAAEQSGGACLGRATVEGGSVDLGCVSLADLMWIIAFGIRANRLTAPDWMDIERFDISARLPQGASEDQIPEMLQALLQDRFALYFHRVYRNELGYALVVSGGGLKLTEVRAPALVSAADPTSGGMMNINGIRFHGTRIPVGGGPPILVMSTPRMGTVRDLPSRSLGGTKRWEALNITLGGLADLLVIATGRRTIVDMTGLKGRYEVTLEVSMAEVAAAMAEPTPDSATAQDALFDAVQNALKKLGLQLERRAVPVLTIFVDQMERTPSGN
jgi:uncharacterized protein (TIGR03435 family)